MGYQYWTEAKGCYHRSRAFTSLFSPLLPSFFPPFFSSVELRAPGGRDRGGAAGITVIMVGDLISTGATIPPSLSPFFPLPPPSSFFLSFSVYNLCSGRCGSDPAGAGLPDRAGPRQGHPGPDLFLFSLLFFFSLSPFSFSFSSREGPAQLDRHDTTRAKVAKLPTVRPAPGSPVAAASFFPFPLLFFSFLLPSRPA